MPISSSQYPKCMLSVVIPSYNHNSYLLQNVPRIRDYLHRLGLKHEIIIVDDGSTDGTPEAISKLGCMCMRNRKNMGKGFSLRKGIAAANGQHILLTDTDLAAPIENFAKLWKHRRYDIVFGSRRADGAQVKRLTLQRKVMGGAYHHVLRAALRLPIQDTQCGFKLLSKRAKDLAALCRLNGFVFDTELAYLAKKKGYRMIETGITWEAKPDSRVVVWKHPAQMLFEVMMIFYNDAKGKYK